MPHNRQKLPALQSSPLFVRSLTLAFGYFCLPAETSVSRVLQMTGRPYRLVIGLFALAGFLFGLSWATTAQAGLLCSQASPQALRGPKSPGELGVADGGCRRTDSGWQVLRGMSLMSRPRADTPAHDEENHRFHFLGSNPRPGVRDLRRYSSGGRSRLLAAGARRYHSTSRSLCPGYPGSATARTPPLPPKRALWAQDSAASGHLFRIVGNAHRLCSHCDQVSPPPSFCRGKPHPSLPPRKALQAPSR